MNDYDPEKPSTFITYLDKNNLYVWSMSEYLMKNLSGQKILMDLMLCPLMKKVI